MSNLILVVNVLFGLGFGVIPVGATLFAQKKAGKRSGAFVFFGYAGGFILAIASLLAFGKIGVDSNVTAFFISFILTHIVFVFRAILS